MSKISTSKLAKNNNKTCKRMFLLLEKHWLIKKNQSIFSFVKQSPNWILTEKWINEYWWEIKKSTKYWNYIIWPENIFKKKIENKSENKKSSDLKLITVTELSESLWIPARKINKIISEIWWIEKTIKWWKLTKLWNQIWWQDFKHKSWTSFVKWPEDIIKNKTLLDNLWIFENNNSESEIWSIKSDIKHKIKTDSNFREKFPAQYRTKDGHNVRSRWEVIIDNTLYEYWLAHAYERKLPIEEDVYTDFYIPAKD